MKILLIVSGGIAAVKSYDLVRELMKNGCDVTVILTHSAQKFVTVTAMTSLTKNTVYTDLFDIDLEKNIGHIALSRNVDKVLVAPATADIIAKIAHGLCDDLATTTLAACDKPIYIAPSMNPVMWINPAQQRNIELLKLNPLIYIINPEYGLMACGETGIGRMAEVPTLIHSLNADTNQYLAHKHILITAGATVEHIDPVRFISNFSSGKQGFALATQAIKMGAKVTLIAGNTHLQIPKGTEYVRVKTATQMLGACLDCIEKNEIDIGICTAAVCDWKPEYFAQKLKKQNDIQTLTLAFTKNPDILKTIGHHAKRPKYLIGFAAETENILANAKKKLTDKNCDVIYANKTDEQSDIFGSDMNEVIEIKHSTSQTLQRCSKIQVSEWILRRVPMIS